MVETGSGLELDLFTIAALGRLAGMGYDQELADRIRRLIGSDPDLTEKRTFGGLAFLLAATMAIAARAAVLCRFGEADQVVCGGTAAKKQAPFYRRSRTPGRTAPGAAARANPARRLRVF